MSRLKDIPHVWTTVGPWAFTKRVYNQMWEDDLLTWAAALAYSWLFALFPFLIFALSLLPLVVPLLPGRWQDPAYQQEQIQGFINAALVTGENTVADGATTAPATGDGALWDGWFGGDEDEGEDPDVGEVPRDGLTRPAPAAEDFGEGDAEPDATVVAPVPGEEGQVDTRPDVPGAQPPAITRTITDIVDGILTEPDGGRITLSILIALFTASGGMAMTMAGLDKCYDVQRPRPIYTSRPIAMLLTVVVALMILAALIALPIAGTVIDQLARRAELGERFTQLLSVINPIRWFVGLLLLLGVLALIYRWGPSVRTRMHLLSPGSLFCIAMWLATAWGFNFYLSKLGAAENYVRTYGAVAGVAVLMLLFYIDALALLLGAEINAEIDFIKFGIRSGTTPEEAATAPIPPYELDEEDLELKAELEDRRSIDIAPEHPGSPVVRGDGEGI